MCSQPEGLEGGGSFPGQQFSCERGCKVGLRWESGRAPGSARDPTRDARPPAGPTGNTYPACLWARSCLSASGSLMASGVHGPGDLPDHRRETRSPGRLPTAGLRSARGARKVPKAPMRAARQHAGAIRRLGSRSPSSPAARGRLGVMRWGHVGPEGPIHRKGCLCKNYFHSVRLA